MRNKINIKSLAFGAILGAIVMFSVGAASEHTDSTVTKWEYQKVNSIDQLNKAAADRWVLVDCPAYYDSDSKAPNIFYILKRQKREE